jgi:hypothetical protein
MTGDRGEVDRVQVRGFRHGGKRIGAGRPPGLPKTGGRSKGCTKTGGRQKGTPNKVGWHLIGTAAGFKTLKRHMDDASSPRHQLAAKMLFLRVVTKIVNGEL